MREGGEAGSTTLPGSLSPLQDEPLEWTKLSHLESEEKI